MKKLFSKYNYICHTCLTLIILLLIFCHRSDAYKDYYNVMVLHSYDPEYVYTRIFNSFLKEKFSEYEKPVNIYFEYLDAKRFDYNQYYQQFNEYIITKYKNRKIDFILCFDDDALQYLLAERENLGNISFIPVIFGSIADRALIYFSSLESNMTGVFEDVDVAANVEMMFQILPAKNIFVISDRTTLGMDLYEKARLVFKNMEDISVEYLIGVPWEEITKKLQNAPDKSALFLLSYLRDDNDNVYSLERVNELLNDISLPVFTLLTPLVNLGGALASYAPTPEAQIEAMIEILDSILAGNDIRYIPITINLPKNLIVNYPMLKRFEIHKSSLPQNHILINIPETFYMKYKRVLLPAVCILSGLSVIVFLLLINIKKRKNAEISLNREITFLKQLMETIPDAICYIDNEGYIKLYNKAFENYLSSDIGQIRGCKLFDCISDISLRGDLELEGSHLTSDGEFKASQHLFKDRNGRIHYLKINKKQVTNGDGTLGYLIVMTDITQLVQMQESLRGQKRRLELTLARSKVAYYERNIKTGELQLNPLAYEILGYDKEEIKSISQFKALVHPDDRQSYESAIKQALEQDRGIYNNKFRIRKKNGTYMWVETTAVVTEHDLEGRPLFLAGIFWDITEDKIREMKTKQLIEGLYTSSTVDALTGALNRKGLQDKLSDLITKCRDYGKDISIFLFDIDGFKLINDTYGHLVGDLVLKELSETVRKTIREDDVFVRWGGDEFLLISMISLNQALHIAHRLRKNVESRLFSGIHVTISIGISQYLPDEPFERAIERADKALYNSKSRGKNSVSVERR